MKVLGLIGGMSWESSAVYYQAINRAVARRLGSNHSARLLLWSLDFAEVERLQHEGRWDDLRELMIDAARRLERGGAELLLLCTNTMHRLADQLTAAVPVPLLHIADPTAERIKAAGIRRVGLIGTAFTMEGAFYKDRLRDRHGLDVIVPPAADRELVHRIIYDELVGGIIRDQSRDTYRAVMAALVARGAEGIILGCTEIMLLVDAGDSAVPLFDTTTIHAEAAVEQAIG